MATSRERAARSVLTGGTPPLGGDAPSRWLTGAGLGLTAAAPIAIQNWGRAGKTFTGAANFYNRAANKYSVLNLGQSLLDVTEPRPEIGDPSVYTDPETGEQMDRSAVIRAREAAGQHSPGGEAFRNVIEPGNVLKNLSDYFIGATPAGLALMANQLTAGDDAPAGKIPVLSSIQKARDWASRKISKSPISKGITEGLGTVYDKTIGKVMETAPARALHKGVGIGYGMLDVAAGGLMPGGQQKPSEGYIAKGLGALDKAMGGYFPGGQTPAEFKEAREARNVWAYGVARGHTSIEDSRLYVAQDYNDYIDYIGPAGLEQIAWQNVGQEREDALLASAGLSFEEPGESEVERMRKWYNKREAENWIEAGGGGRTINTMGTGVTGVLGIPGLGVPGQEPTVDEDTETLEHAMKSNVYDAAAERAAERIAEFMLDRGGVANPGAMIGIAGKIDERLEAKTSEEFEKRAAELALERARERARERFSR